jgi:ABC-type sugar transport system ATPase subunit
MDKSTQTIRSLSGGNQQKIIIARWTITKPVLILADDPTKGVDIQTRHEVHNVIYQIVAKGAAVVFVSSDDAEVVELTKSYGNSRVLIMYKGEIIHILEGENITSENIAAFSVPRVGELKKDV